MAEIPSPDPQAILKSLESELALHRQPRAQGALSRTKIRVGSLVFVIVGLVASLLVLNYLAEIARNSRRSEAPLPTLVLPLPALFSISHR